MSTVVPKPREAKLPHAVKAPLRFVTAASLFDGHDAAINIMRRIIQSAGRGSGASGPQPLGRRRGARRAAGRCRRHRAVAPTRAATSSTSNTWSTCCKNAAPAHIRVFGGGGGTITPEEIAELQAYGVERIYHPNDGMHMGLAADDRGRGARARSRTSWRRKATPPTSFASTTRSPSAACSTAIEEGMLAETELARLRKQWQLAGNKTPVVGSPAPAAPANPRVVDELLLRFLHAFPRHAHRRACCRPHAPAHRRRAAGRPHPHEFAAQPARVHALHGHAPRSTPPPAIVLHDCIGFLTARPTTWSSSRPPASASPIRRSSTWSISRCT